MNKKHALGFDKGYIYLFKGNQEFYEDWFKESVCRYHGTFGWYLASDDFDKLISIPTALEQVKLNYDQVFINDNQLKPKAEIEAAVFSVLYGDSASNFVGTVGERLALTLKCTYVKNSASTYGSQTFHMFEDKDGNAYTWSTAAKTLELGKIYKCRATIKAHQVYKGQKQTVLTRAMQFEEKESF